MPGLVGCVDDQPIPQGLIGAMVGPMRHRPTYRIRRHCEERLAIASIDLSAGRQQDWAESADRRYLLVVFGAIYEPGIPRLAGAAAELLSRWERQGSVGLADLNGEYLISVWDRANQRLVIVNDRLGLKRLNIWHKALRFAFASELKSLAALARVSRAVDEQALAELLIFGHLQDDRMLLGEVKLLPPASVLIWQRGRLAIREYWRCAYKADPAFDDFDRAVEEYAARAKRAVARRISACGRVGLLLSGGLDSRALGGIARKLHPAEPIRTETAGHAHAHDVRFARQIAQAIKSRHATIDIPETFLQDCAAEYAWVLDGMVSAHGCHRACVLPRLSGQVDTVLIGFLGDVLSGGKPFDKVAHLRSVEALIEEGYRLYATGFDDPLLARLLRPSVWDRVRGQAREAFGRSVRAASVEHPADRVVSAELIQRQRMWNPPAQMDLMGIDVQVATPFTDRDFVDFALRLPAQHRMERRAYQAMIARELPLLARIPRSGEGLPLVRSRLRESLHWRWTLFERHTLPQWTGGRFGGHSYASFVHCAEWFQRANRAFIESTLIDNPLLAEHFEMTALNRLVRDFLDSTTSQDLMIGIASLVSFAVFRQRLEERLSPSYPEPALAAAKDAS